MPKKGERLEKGISQGAVIALDGIHPDAQHVEALRHSKSYSDLLDVYVKAIRCNIRIKNWLKILFFLITMGAFAAVVYCFYESLEYARTIFSKIENIGEASVEAVMGMAAVVLPSVCSLVVAFVKIPETIARYLFNTKEDSYIKSVIKNIQDYDKGMFEIESGLRELLERNKDQTEETKDEEILNVSKKKKGNSAKKQDV